MFSDLSFFNHNFFHGHVIARAHDMRDAVRVADQQLSYTDINDNGNQTHLLCPVETHTYLIFALYEEEEG